MRREGSLPIGWVWARICEVAEVNPPWDCPMPSDDDLVTFIPMRAVEEESGQLDASITRPWREVRSGYTRFREGDVLFAKITPCMENGKFAIAHNLFGSRGVGSTEFHVIRPTAALSAQYLLNFLLQRSFRRDARLSMKGAAGQLRVPSQFVLEALLPLPPVAEQRRIVAKIEELFTRLDAAVAALKRGKANLKRYRAAVLKAACEGRLVPTEAELARAEGRTYESGEELLARILKQRRARWEANQIARMRAQGNLPTDSHWRIRYEEPHGPDTSTLLQLPDGWCWANLLQIAELKGGITKGQKRRPQDVLRRVPYLRVANVQRGYLDLADVKQIEATEQEIDELKLEPGDILFNEGGDRDKLGRGWIWHGEIPECIHQNHVFRARLYLSEVKPQFVSWYGNTFGQQYFMEQGKQTTNLASINLTKLRELPVPLPPAAEQRRIVAEVERRLSLVEELERDIEASLKRAERLRQSILKRAFEGKLVPQDPSDEPAGVLLERIRAERTAIVEQPKRRDGRAPVERRRRSTGDLGPLVKVHQFTPSG